MVRPVFDQDKKTREKKKRLTITVVILLSLAILIFGGILLTLKLQLGSLRTTFHPVQQIQEQSPMTPAPLGKNHPSLTYADWDPYFFHEKLVYCDSNYQVHVKTEIDQASVLAADRFSEGLARVSLKGKNKSAAYIYIGLSGKVELDSSPDREFSGAFSEGLACCVEKESGKLGFIDKKGKYAIKPQFVVSFHTSGAQVQKQDQLDNCVFSSGLAPVYNAKVNAPDLSPACGYIDHKGKYVIPVAYVEGYPFVDERARVCVKDQSKWGRRWGFIDTKGKVIHKPILMQIEDYSDGLAAVLDYKGQWGYIDKAGKYVIPASYSDAQPFSEEIAAVAKVKNNKRIWGYIRNDGSWLLEPRFDKASPFKDGEAHACIGCDDPNAKLVEEFSIKADGKVEKLKSKISPLKIPGFSLPLAGEKTENKTSDKSGDVSGTKSIDKSENPLQKKSDGN